MAPKKNKKKPNGKARADEISADFGYDESEPDVEIKDEETAADLKVRGNECVKSGDHAVAIKLFTVAIERNPPKEELHLYHSNRSVCALSLKRFPMAIADAEKCVALKPDWSKGYSRLGAAHFYAGNLKESVKAYASGLALDPTNATITEGLAAAQAALAAKAEKTEATEAKEAKAEKAATPEKKVSWAEMINQRSDLEREREMQMASMTAAAEAAGQLEPPTEGI